MSSTLGLIGQVGVALARRPQLVPVALRQARSLAPQRWWAKRPWLPIPSRDYMRFRNVTLSGDEDALPTADDIIVYLEWCRSMQALPSRDLNG